MNASDWERRHGLSPETARALAAQVADLEAAEALAPLLEGLLASVAAAGDVPLPTGTAAGTAMGRLAYAAPFLLRHLTGQPWLLRLRLLEGLEAPADLVPLEAVAPADWAGLDEAAAMAALRHWKYANYVRLTALDLLDVHDARRTCVLLSRLAEGMVEAAYRFAFARQAARYGLPVAADGRLAGGAVIGMGKLGGGELNYSSDIDLIFIHAGGDEPTRALPAGALPPLRPAEPPGAHWARWEALAGPGEPGEATAAELHDRVARQVIRMVSAATAEGIGFRVDVDLRPRGRSGALAPGLRFLQDYYEVHGREWERAAMLKARPIAGSLSVGARFLELVRPFVFRRYLDYSALEGVVLVKHDIDRTHQAARGTDLKLGRGGIRENEFLVQALQLLNGGRQPDLQEPSHHAAVERLAAAGLLEPAEARSLLDDYWLMRRLENRVQMVAESQTQELPEETAERTRVLHDFAPGFAARQPAVEAALEAALERNHARFRLLLTGIDQQEALDAGAWHAAVAAGAAPEGGPEALGRLDRLITGLMQSRAGERCVGKLVHLLTRPELYRQGTDAAFPRWLDFFEQIGNRNSIHTLIAANPSIVGWISHLFAEGGQHAERLVRHPEFLESFFSLAGTGPESLGEIIGGVLDNARDEEEFILELQMAKSQAVIQILTAYLNDPESARHRALLTELADATVSVCARFAWRQTVARLGRPAGAGAEEMAGFAVLAMGKQGSRDLRFGSDLDLVFLYGADGTTSAGRSHYEFYTKVAQRLSSLLTSPTQFGRLFELDHRLRPFGNKGLLVPSLAAYRSFLPEAEVWNFQAFTRMRHICGDAALSRTLLEAIAAAWHGRPRPHGRVAREVQAMLLRLVEAHGPPPGTAVLPLKYAVGGMIGFEFLSQAHFLCAQHPGQPWTLPPPHATIARLEPVYGDLGRLDERLSFHVPGYRHEAEPRHFETLAAVRERWSFVGAREQARVLRRGVEETFREWAG